MITVLFAYGTGNLFTKSFFSSNIELRKLPYGSKLMKQEIYIKTAQEVMIEPKLFLYYNAKINDIYKILTTAESICVGDFIPIVQENNFQLLGTVKIANLIKYVNGELKIFSVLWQNYAWMNDLHTLLEIYRFLDEEVRFIYWVNFKSYFALKSMSNPKEIIRRAKKIGTQIKEKKIFRFENFKFLLGKKDIPQEEVTLFFLKKLVIYFINR